MTRVLRMALVLLLATSILVVIPGEADATVPGGIGRIVFLSDADDPNGDIYVRDFAGSSPIRLTTGSTSESWPHWSPEGTQIVFSDDAPSVGGVDVYVMNPDGSNRTNLTNGAGTTNYAHAWSPDGSKILIASTRGGQIDLWTIMADGSNPTQLTNDTHIELDADWSPDGTQIAFGRAIGPNADVWIMNADGSGQQNITNRPRQELSPSWSPDGSKIAFDSDLAGDWDIWVMGADGSNPTNLTNSMGTIDNAAAWSPDGTKIAFQSNRDGDYDIWMMNPDGTDVGHLTDHPADEAAVDWESVNRLPAAVDDTTSVQRAGSVVVDVVANDSDPDGEPLTLVDITRMPDHGSAAIVGPGTVEYTHDGSVPPGSPSSFADSFEYEIRDSRMGLARAIVIVSIQAGFDDVPPSHTFYDDINWLAGLGITRGCNPPDNTLFCPEESVTRGQMAAFLVRTLHYTAGGGDDLFVDDDGSVFEIDIDKLGTAGVTKGCNPPINDRFCPGEPVTRGQMAAFLARAFKLTNLGQADLFVDDDGSVFEVEIDKLGATGVSRGCNPPVNDRFCPNQDVTRAQMAAFIRRAVGYVT